MPKSKKKIPYKSQLEFITAVAEDCIQNLTDSEKASLIRNPYAHAYHLSYGLYIRNHYIHNEEFSHASFRTTDPDYLSYRIIQMIFSKLLPEYDYDNYFVRALYNDRRFIELRSEYRRLYGAYPVVLVEEYKNRMESEPVMSTSELSEYMIEVLELRQELHEGSYEICSQQIEQLVKQLADAVWRLDDLRTLAGECGIAFELLIPRIEEIKRTLSDEMDVLPMEVCFLPYRDEIEQEQYIRIRTHLCEALEERPYLIKYIDHAYFDDRVLAEAVLKYGWTLKHLTQYQDDEEMVMYCLSHDGTAIQYAAKRFQMDREWVRFAIEHSQNRAIMSLDCMKPYRKDKELVYLACKTDRRNYTSVDEAYRDDYELAKICLEQIGNPESMYRFMSLRLRENKSLAFLDLQEKVPNTEHYSSKLKMDEEIAAELYRLHGADSESWNHMSRQLRKQYQVKEN